MISCRRILRVLGYAIPFVVAFVAMAVYLARLDTAFFAQKRLPSSYLDLGALIWTPYNLLKYNLSSTNLAEHGLHPRYLHMVANWPMLFGVGLWGVVNFGWDCLRSDQGLAKAANASDEQWWARGKP